MKRALGVGCSTVFFVVGFVACSSSSDEGPLADGGNAGAGAPSSAHTGGTAGASGSGSGTGGHAGTGGGSSGARGSGGTAGADGGKDGAMSPDSGADADAAIATYECVGGKVARALTDAGEESDAATLPSEGRVVPWTQSVGTCNVGATYCYVRSSELVRDAPPTATCESLPTGCEATPSCACVCSHGVRCDYVNCSCKDDANGHAIYACDQI